MRERERERFVWPFVPCPGEGGKDWECLVMEHPRRREGSGEDHQSICDVMQWCESPFRAENSIIRR